MMERLTSKDHVYMKCEGITPCKVYDKLKEYEDLGLTPEDIAHLAQFYKKQTSAEAIEANMKIVAKLLQAENKEAHWIPSRQYNDNSFSGLLRYVEGYECSECGRFEEEKEPYCNCGCKMTEEIK
jgi:hypothetical protein